MRTFTLTAALISISTTFAAPATSIPPDYKWNIDQWTGDWYGIGWANFYLSSPRATSGDVVIPALSFTNRCTNVAGSGGQKFNCNDLIKDNDGTRTIEFTLLPFDQSLQEVQLDTVYRFKSGARLVNFHSD